MVTISHGKNLKGKGQIIDEMTNLKVQGHYNTFTDILVRMRKRQ